MPNFKSPNIAIMDFYLNKTIPYLFDHAIEKIIAALDAEGFGIITEIDLHTTLKKKLDVDFYNYKILGACNPTIAYKALLAEDKIGTLLPCNVIVQEKVEGRVEISAINPVVSMMAVENRELQAIAIEIRDKLKRVIDRL